MSDRPGGPGKLRGSNIFLKKDKEHQEKKKRAVAPPPTPPPATKFTPEAVARRESMQRRKSKAVEGEKDNVDAAAESMTGATGAPPTDSAATTVSTSEAPTPVDSTPLGDAGGGKEDHGDAGEDLDENPNMGRASISRGSRSLPSKSKRSFRSSVTEGTEEIKKALADARGVAAPAPAPAAPAGSSRPPPPKPPTKMMPPPPRGPPGAPSSDSDSDSTASDNADPFSTVDEAAAKKEEKAEEAVRRMSMRKSAPAKDMYADRASEVMQFENPMKASDLPPPPSVSASEDERPSEAERGQRKKEIQDALHQEHLASVSRAFGRPDALSSGAGSSSSGGSGGSGGGRPPPPIPVPTSKMPPPPSDTDESSSDFDGSTTDRKRSSVTWTDASSPVVNKNRPPPAGPPPGAAAMSKPLPMASSSPLSAGSSSSSSEREIPPATSPEIGSPKENPFRDVEGEQTLGPDGDEETKDEIGATPDSTPQKRNSSSSKPTFYQGVTPRGSGNAGSLGYTRNSLSSADLNRLNDLFDRWVGTLGATVEEQVNKSLVGLAGITIASGSLAPAPASASGGAKTGIAAIEPVSKSMFTVKDVEYTLKESAAASKDNNKQLLASILSSHNRELEALKESVSKEREATVHAQRAMEHSLKLRVDNLSEALAVKVKQEADLRLTRAVELAHRQSLNDSAAIIKMYEAEKESELKVSTRFKEIVSELHASWEQEQSMRAEHLADVTSTHYRAVIDHLEKQLSSALSLQSEVDKRWLEELETRSKNQAETLYAFEEKCKNLYNDRFRKYVKVSNKKLANYEKQLLEVGSNLSAEKHKYDSRLRRVKWACLKWKRMYQMEVETRYAKAIETLEAQYGSEIERLLSEVSDTRSAVTASVTRLSGHEKSYLDSKAAQESIESAAAAPDITSGDSGASFSGGTTTADLVHELTLAWDKQRVAPEEKIRLLTTLLNEAAPTPALMRTYELAHARLEARVPLLEIRSKKNYLEFKLRQSKASSGGQEGPDAAAIQRELRTVSAGYDDACRKYQEKFNESFEA